MHQIKKELGIKNCFDVLNRRVEEVRLLCEDEH